MTSEKKETDALTSGKDETTEHGVDYYYLEAMRYLSCSDHHDSDSDTECSCKKCSNDSNGNDSSLTTSIDDLNNIDSSGRERSWSHSMADDYESGTISQLPTFDKMVSSRLKNRRYSDGMLLKPNMKVTMGRVQWADDCKKELTRFRPRKKYLRNPSVKAAPVKSILKNPSDENLYVSYEEGESETDEEEDGDGLRDTPE